MKNRLLLKSWHAVDLASLSARIMAGAVLFPHGAQKLLGCWGGHGYQASMQYFTETLGLPYLIGMLVIAIEFLLPLLLIVGLFTRASAAIIAILMAGIIITVQHRYFFMNWFGDQQGEGMEFFLQMIGLCLVCLFLGSGKYAIDSYLTKTNNEK